MHESQHGVVAFRAAVAVEEMVEAGRRDFGEHRRQFDHRRVGRLEERVVERQFLDLAICGIGELLAAVADVHAPEAGHPVDDLVAVGVPQIDAVGLHDHAAARTIERAHVGERVDVVRGVERAVFGARACMRRARCGFASFGHGASVFPSCGRVHAYTCSSKWRRSHELITRKNASYSVSFSARYAFTNLSPRMPASGAHAAISEMPSSRLRGS
ncbi:hypothetical protein BTE28158_05420 [Burkholderia territorii]|nr:hypothetical protein BTE28158_05420 [Burkholderia territorii]